MISLMKKVLLLLLVLSVPVFAADFPSWMAGSWRLDAHGTRVEEQWTTAAGGIMIGMSKTVPAKGKTMFEFVRIAEVDGKLAYLAMPDGQLPTTFPLKSSTDSRIVFENPQHDFPQRVIYWRAGEKLCARIEGTMNGKAEGEEWCYSREARPGGVR